MLNFGYVNTNGQNEFFDFLYVYQDCNNFMTENRLPDQYKNLSTLAKKGAYVVRVDFKGQSLSILVRGGVSEQPQPNGNHFAYMFTAGDLQNVINPNCFHYEAKSLEEGFIHYYFRSLNMSIRREETMDEEFWSDKNDGYVVRLSNRPEKHSFVRIDLKRNGKIEQSIAVDTEFQNDELQFASPNGIGLISWNTLLANLNLAHLTNYTPQLHRVAVIRAPAPIATMTTTTTTTTSTLPGTAPILTATAPTMNTRSVTRASAKNATESTDFTPRFRSKRKEDTKPVKKEEDDVKKKRSKCANFK